MTCRVCGSAYTPRWRSDDGHGFCHNVVCKRSKENKAAAAARRQRRASTSTAGASGSSSSFVPRVRRLILLKDYRAPPPLDSTDVPQIDANCFAQNQKQPDKKKKKMRIRMKVKKDGKSRRPVPCTALPIL